jgi:hypothetical protein
MLQVRVRFLDANLGEEAHSLARGFREIIPPVWFLAAFYD